MQPEDMGVGKSNQTYIKKPLHQIVKNKLCRGFYMKDYIEERAVEIAYYIIEHEATVRQTAKQFGVSKSTIHKDVTDPSPGGASRRLQRRQEKSWTEINLNGGIRGGLATREKYVAPSRILKKNNDF